jgi:SAM-dependent methyltransferase
MRKLELIDINTTDFFQIFETFLAHTNEKARTVAAISHQVLPRLKQRRHFLDVGCGDGAISIPLIEYFENYLCIDLNHESLEEFRVNLKTDKIGQILQLDMNTYSPSGTADFILFSFSMGYLGAGIADLKQRARFRIEKFKEYYEVLNDGGAISLVGADYRGPYKKLFDYFNIPMHDELKSLHDYIGKNYKTDSYYFPIDIITDTLDEMILTIRLILYDDGTKYLHKVGKILEYATRLKREDGKFHFSYNCELMTVYKSGGQ